MGPPEADIRSTYFEKRTILKLTLFSILIGVYPVSAWTYHYSDIPQTWDGARIYCQTNYTNMVFIRNKNENKHLNETLPGQKKHYWIGIQQVTNDTWIWVETQQPVPEDVQNWATGEPSKSTREACVELYINRPEDSGKWNNDRCNKPKIPLCYQESCINSTCSHRGECIEDIGNYNCECWPGFHGNNCEHAVSCADLQIPENGHIKCNYEYGKFTYKSFCNFSCDVGYELYGSKAVFCQHTGEWSEPAPTCLAISCVDLQIPENGKKSCTNEYGKPQYKSFCNFSCDEGYVLNGTKSLFCQNTGEWSEPTPTCLAVSCVELQNPANGKISCTDEYGKFQYKSFCNFSCDEGYELNGTQSVFCQNKGEWSEPTPTCLAGNVSFGKQKQITIVSSVLGSGLFLSGIPILYILSYLRKKKKENSHIIKTTKEPPNTFENPAFEDKDMASLDL